MIRRSAAAVSKVVSEHTAESLLESTKEILIHSTGMAASAAPQEYAGSASGSLNWAGSNIGNIVINIISN
ncbi:MAG: hypothetical protein ABI707_15870 [Ferruginibacter sp.]